MSKNYGSNKKKEDWERSNQIKSNKNDTSCFLSLSKKEKERKKNSQTNLMNILTPKTPRIIKGISSYSCHGWL